MTEEHQPSIAALEKSDIFRGLDADALSRILRQMEPRHFRSGEVICCEGEPGKSLFLVGKGLLEVVLRRPEGVVSIALLREGDIVGELSVLVEEPRSADVIARTPGEVFELGAEKYRSLLALYPQISANLNQVLVQRLRQSTLKLGQARLHRETQIVLVSDPETAQLALDLVAAVKAASVREVGVILCRPIIASDAGVALPDAESALAARDQLARSCSLILVVARTDEPHLEVLLETADRCLLIASPAKAAMPSALKRARGAIELCFTSAAGAASRSGFRIVRTLDRNQRDADLAWLGRHVARTKLGLALGAGGARGYAHVGVIEILEQAGLAIDYVAGSSIGALIGYFIACGMRPGDIDGALRDIFNPHNVEEMLRTSVDGSSVGLDSVLQDLRKWTRTSSFADLSRPLTMMTADLVGKKPVAINEGPIYEAVYAAMAVPGLVPPYERGTELLVDALTLVPVPVAALKAAGADVTIGVNLLSRDTLESWPAGPASVKAPRRRRMRMIDILMESLDMLQLDTSVRNAAEADVVLTPRFGPSTWRDYHLADLFYAAGRATAQQQLPEVLSLTRPARRGIGSGHSAT